MIRFTFLLKKIFNLTLLSHSAPRLRDIKVLAVTQTVFHLKYYIPFNDNIENAYPLQLGQNGPFTNQGATVQNNEPNPPDPADACNTQHTWCQCNISDTILDNSVWFTFQGPETGTVGINVPGFDDQIAVYQADSYSDILSGDTSKYKILAANDDYFGQDSSYSALIEAFR